MRIVITYDSLSIVFAEVDQISNGKDYIRLLGVDMFLKVNGHRIANIDTVMIPNEWLLEAYNVHLDTIDEEVN